MINIILWDVDGTLLDFDAAERAAIRTLFAEFGLGECTDAMLARYHDINNSFWQRLERNEITRSRVLIGRFEQFFAEYGIDAKIAPEFNARYQPTLGETIVYRDDSLNIVKALKGKIKQYVVSNGTVAAQTKKLERSKLGELMDGVFLSEELRVEKPAAAFFDRVLSAVRAEDRSKVMIVGDSLTSDIRGGMNAGIKTCWYDPEGKPVPEGYRVDHVISDLHELENLIENKTPVTECRNETEKDMREDNENRARAARRGDWKTEPMPEQHETFVLNRAFGEEEMAVLRFGNIPQAMEDKWFRYMEGSTLWAHRSWTGYCIYRIDFKEDNAHVVTVNRDPEQYRCTSIEDDIENLNDLLDRWTRTPGDYYNEWLAETYKNLRR